MAEMLIVSSWQKFPSTFGLKGFTDKYPDSVKILSSIMGEKGWPGRRLPVKMGEAHAMTRSARRGASAFQEEEIRCRRDATHRLNRDHDQFPKVLFDSSRRAEVRG